MEPITYVFQFDLTNGMSIRAEGNNFLEVYTKVLRTFSITTDKIKVVYNLNNFK